MEKSVLVVGAGPVGLLLAAELKKYNIKVRLIEKEKNDAKYSKALSVNAASLKLFHGLGAVNELLLRGKVVSDVNIYYNNKKISVIRKKYLKSPYNYYLSVPQPETEKCLENLLNQYNGYVDYNKKLLNIRQFNNYVYVKELDVTNGNIDETFYDYVIGCDGASSDVRKSLDIPFSGKDYGMHFIMGDVYFNEATELNNTSYHVSTDGFMIILPMANGLTRLVIKKDKELPLNRPKPELKELQEQLDKVYLGELTIREVIWSSSAQFFNRLAQTNHVGRVFLAGDAFHLFSPIGGQGMNTGLQDAMNLAWKLAFVINGFATESLITTYYLERYQAVRKILHQTDLNTILISDIDFVSDKRKFFFPLMRNRKYYRDALPLEFSGLGSDYSSKDKFFEGSHVPYMKISKYVSIIHDSYQIPMLGKNIIFSIHKLDNHIEETCKSFIKIVYVSSDDCEIIDVFKLSQSDICLIRPDGYIGFHGDIKNLKIYLKKYYNSGSIKDVAS